MISKSSQKPCGWNSYPILTPIISGLSNYESVSGSTNTLVAIIGNNFRNYSIIKFNTTTIVPIFISSLQINFYIPNGTLNGTYTIQVFTENLASNIVSYEIIQNSGYWNLNTTTNQIYNNSVGGTYFNGPISGLSFFTGNLDTTLNDGDNYLYFITSNANNINSSNTYPNPLTFSYIGTYLIMLTITFTNITNTISNNPTTISASLFPNLTPQTTPYQTISLSNVWNTSTGTSFNATFFYNNPSPNSGIYITLSLPSDTTYTFNTTSSFLIISQIG